MWMVCILRAERRIPDLPSIVRAAREQLAGRAHRLLVALPNLVAKRRAGLAAQRLPALQGMMEARLGSVRLAAAQLEAGQRAAIAAHGRRLAVARLTAASVQGAVREARSRLGSAAARLESVSPAAVLARGYAMVSDAAGHPVTMAAAVAAGARLRLRFSDGQVGVTADGRTAATGRAAPSQGMLGLSSSPLAGSKRC